MSRALNRAQLEGLSEIGDLREEEVRIEKRARRRLEQMVQEETATARLKLAQHVAHLHYNLGINKSQIAAIGFGTSNRKVIYELLELAGPPESSTSKGAVKVERHDDGVSIHLDNFSHPDLGDELFGTVVFDSEGNFTESTKELHATIAEDFLWADTLWGLPIVQEQL